MKSPQIQPLSSPVPSTSLRAFVGVACRSHVMRGSAGGFAQVCHGKQAPLMRMQAGDWFVYYSPTSELRTGEPLRAFSAIGRVSEHAAYRFDMGGGFVPFRRDVHYVQEAKQVALAALSSRLHFTQRGSNWGMLARRGHFEIDLHDLRLIASEMGVRDAP